MKATSPQAPPRRPAWPPPPSQTIAAVIEVNYDHLQMLHQMRSEENMLSLMVKSGSAPQAVAILRRDALDFAINRSR